MDSEHQRRLAAIMFTDIVGYSALAQVNEDLSIELLEEHRELLRPLFPRFGGREIETIGDAFFLEFGSVQEAVHCAIEIQKVLNNRNASEPAERKIFVRIGKCSPRSSAGNICAMTLTRSSSLKNFSPIVTSAKLASMDLCICLTVSLSSLSLLSASFDDFLINFFHIFRN